jgi:hypothetical protein
MNKKKTIIIVAIVIFIIMLIPVPLRLKDGGSVEYKAILYKYTKIHRLNEQSPTGYENGWELRILDFYVGGNSDINVSVESVISIKTDDKIINAHTGSFCYNEGVCLDKIDFQEFRYDVINSYYNNKLYIENLNGDIKSIKLFDYGQKTFLDTEVDFTNEYIITPSISGLFIVKINAIYQGKNISYYFMTNISKTNGEEINIKLKLKENSLTNTGLTMIVENDSDKELEYGETYSIERYVGGYWKSVLPINDFAFNLPAYGLKKGESKELSINWEYGYGRLKGKFRIVKSFSYKDKDDYVLFNKYLEFKI